MLFLIVDEDTAVFFLQAAFLRGLTNLVEHSICSTWDFAPQAHAEHRSDSGFGHFCGVGAAGSVLAGLLQPHTSEPVAVAFDSETLLDHGEDAYIPIYTC